jgi:hypothetical protein
LAPVRIRGGTLRSLRRLGRDGKDGDLSDTPIYDQIRQELEAGAGRTEPSVSRRSRSGDDDNQAVSVWALVNQHRNGKRR